MSRFKNVKIYNIVKSLVHFFVRKLQRTRQKSPSIFITSLLMMSKDKRFSEVCIDLLGDLCPLYVS